MFISKRQYFSTKLQRLTMRLETDKINNSHCNQVNTNIKWKLNTKTTLKISIRKSMDRQRNDQQKKDKRTTHDLQNNTHKTKDQITRTPLKTGGELRCTGMVSSSCSTSGTRRVIFSMKNIYASSAINQQYVRDGAQVLKNHTCIINNIGQHKPYM